MRLDSLVFQHDIEELTTVSTSLHRAVNVEIKDRERFHFDNFSPTVAYEKLFDTNLEEADALVALRANEHNVSICTELSDSGDLAWKSLCLEESFKRQHTVSIDHTYTRWPIYLPLHSTGPSSQ